MNANDFFILTTSAKPAKLADTIKDIGVTMEAALLKLINSDINLFVICPGWTVISDELFESGNSLYTRSEYERALSDPGTSFAPINKFTHDGFLKLSTSHILSFCTSESITAGRFWHNDELTQYIELSPEQTLTRADIHFDLNQFLDLEALISPKLSSSRKPRSDKDDSLYEIIAGLTFLLIKHDKDLLEPRKEINKSEIARQILDVLEDPKVSDKTIHTKLKLACDSHNPIVPVNDL